MRAMLLYTMLLGIWACHQGEEVFTKTDQTLEVTQSNGYSRQYNVNAHAKPGGSLLLTADRMDGESIIIELADYQPDKHQYITGEESESYLGKVLKDDVGDALLTNMAPKGLVQINQKGTICKGTFNVWLKHISGGSKPPENLTGTFEFEL